MGDNYMFWMGCPLWFDSQFWFIKLTERLVERRQRLVSQQSMRNAEGPEGVNLRSLLRDALTQSKNVRILLWFCFSINLQLWGSEYNAILLSRCEHVLQTVFFVVVTLW